MTTDLDRAILAHRADPTPENRLKVLDAMQEQLDEFHREQADEFIRRTR